MTGLNDLLYGEDWAKNNASDVDFRNKGVEIMVNSYLKDKEYSVKDKKYEETKSSQQRR